MGVTCTLLTNIFTVGRYWDFKQDDVFGIIHQKGTSPPPPTPSPPQPPFFHQNIVTDLYSSADSVLDLRAGSRWFDPKVRPKFFPRIDDSHSDKIHSPLTAFDYLDNVYVGKQPVAWRKYCAEYWLKRTPGKHG